VERKRDVPGHGQPQPAAQTAALQRRSNHRPTTSTRTHLLHHASCEVRGHKPLLVLVIIHAPAPAPPVVVVVVIIIVIQRQPVQPGRADRPRQRLGQPLRRRPAAAHVAVAAAARRDRHVPRHGLGGRRRSGRGGRGVPLPVAVLQLVLAVVLLAGGARRGADADGGRR